jgi:hypothetical protein
MSVKVMTTKEQLIQEIETTPEILLENLLDFLLFVKNRYEDNEVSAEEKESITAAKQSFIAGDYLTLDQYLIEQVNQV